MPLIGVALKAILGALLSGLAKLGTLFVAYRAGESSQAAKDTSKEAQIAQTKAAVDSDLSGLSDDELRQRLREPPGE